MYVCMYVCMYVRTYVRTYVRMYVCTLGMANIDVLECNYCEAKYHNYHIIITLTISIVKTVYKHVTCQTVYKLELSGIDISRTVQYLIAILRYD